MLQLTIPAKECYNEATGEFISTKETTIALEHSLVSLSKWESKWKKPFLSRDERTLEESVDYIRCMTLTQNVDPNVYFSIGANEMQKVNAYLEDPMTATWISDKRKKAGSKNKVITSEVIYGWMISLGIPFECQKWHLNRLMMLIQVCDEQNGPQEKMSKKDIMKSNRALNAARRAKSGRRG